MLLIFSVIASRTLRLFRLAELRDTVILLFMLRLTISSLVCAEKQLCKWKQTTYLSYGVLEYNFEGLT